MQTSLENVNDRPAQQSAPIRIASSAASGPAGPASGAHNELGKAGSDDASEFSVAHAASASSPACADRPACAAPAEPACDGRSCMPSGAACATKPSESAQGDAVSELTAAPPRVKAPRKGKRAQFGVRRLAAAFQSSESQQNLTPAAGSTVKAVARPPHSTTSADTAAAPGPEPDIENRFAAVPPGRKRLPVDGEAFVNAVHRQVDLVQLEVTLLRDEDERIVQRELAYLRELRYGKRASAEADEPRTIIFDAPRPEGDLP